MPQAGFEPTEVRKTGFQLNAKWTLYLQATKAGYATQMYNKMFLTPHAKQTVLKHLCHRSGLCYILSFMNEFRRYCLTFSYKNFDTGFT